MASFFVIRGRDNGQHFSIRGDTTTIGRESSNHIKLNDTEVSRQHAAIRRTAEDQFEISDLGSSNGSYVNSKRIKQHVLHSGDRVQVGRTLMIFTSGPDPHTTQSLDGVEIVNYAGGQADLSQIRHSLDGRSKRTSHEAMQPVDSGNSSRSSGPVLAEGPVADSPVAGSQDWELLYQVSQTIRRTVDLNELLTQVLDMIFHWIGCDRGCVMMLDDVTGQLTPTYSRSRSDAAASNPSLVTESGSGNRRSRRTTAKLQISRTILDYVTSKQEGVLTSNAQDDSRWEAVESISDLGVYEAICVPMLGRYGLVGAIYVDTQTSPGNYVEQRSSPCFSEHHLKLMLAIAGQAAMAIEDTQFYRAMLQAERLATMGQTIATLSHHVKNILQGISGGAYLLQDGLKREDIEIIRRGWKIIERNQDRISNLVMDMLSYSKERQAVLCAGDLGVLLNDIYELMHGRAVDLGVTLSTRTLTQPVQGMFDSEAMHRAVLNVVTNAIDAAAAAYSLRSESTLASETGAEQPSIMPPSVELWAEHSVERGILTIAVRDNGEGIVDEDLQRIFAPFESSKGARGTGLGLPVSQKILREHGGEIIIESQAGKGSTFLLQWPDGQGSHPRESSSRDFDLPAANDRPASPDAMQTVVR